MSKESVSIDYQPHYESPPLRLTKRGRIVLGTIASIAAGAISLGAIQIVNAQRPGPIAHTFEGTINPGGTPEGTLALLEKEKGLDFNETTAGQEASFNQSRQQGHPYVAHPGDITRVFTDVNKKVVSTDIYTLEEQQDDEVSE